MSILDDMRNAMRIVENESAPRGYATIHHPNCALLKADKAAINDGKVTLDDCNCGGAALPVRLR